MNIDQTIEQVLHNQKKSSAGEADRNAEFLLNLLLTVVSQNKLGAALVEDHLLCQAMRHFAGALKNIKQLMQSLDEWNYSSLTQLSKHDEKNTHPKNELLRRDLITVRIETNQTCNVVNDDVDSSNFIVSTPLLLELSHPFHQIPFFEELVAECGCDIIRKNLQKASNAVIFNMGLIYHLMTQNDLFKDNNMTKKASSLYELCYKALEEEDFEVSVFKKDHCSTPSPSCAPSRLLCRLLLLNNLSQLHTALGNYVVADAFKQTLLTYLAWLVQEFKARRMDPSILETFFETTMSLIITDAGTAPAA